MKTNDRRHLLATCIVCATAIGPVGSSLADIGPPVAIKISPGAAAAIAGQEYEGAFEIRVYQPGYLSDFQIEGEGWRVASSTIPTAPVRAGCWHHPSDIPGGSRRRRQTAGAEFCLQRPIRQNRFRARPGASGPQNTIAVVDSVTKHERAAIGPRR